MDAIGFQIAYGSTKLPPMSRALCRLGIGIPSAGTAAWLFYKVKY